MNKYYIYNIKNEFKYVFKDREKALFNFINNLTFQPSNYLEKQAGLIFVPFDNKQLCARFKESFSHGDGYRQLAHLHVLENPDTHQLSYLKIDRYKLSLESEDYQSKFIKVILQSCGNYVIIDFDKKECHWLDNLATTYEYGG